MSDDRKADAQAPQFEISPQDLGTLGLNQIAFIKRATDEEGGEGFVVHTADGTAVRLFATRELAEMAIRQNDLQPLSVH